MSQSELHKYCATGNEADVRFNSQSQKANARPTHQLPDNETDCGWAPFGEFSVAADLRWAVPSGRVLPWRALGYAGVAHSSGPSSLAD